ncbi:inositol monophosphatase [Pseudovirgaria hyperparasitica]|uniref:Inositol-1-monophosphatase n=1 Tax=Pseudovirgaria hyperparasitica TaxID=470096 RepID=A0A6A6WFQ9_9PEZI|nr:inositol monophosphatase [Pseudovirgaria hyperparasitica]KAF2759961.1 inositol monophosphatase [Pseudovirgaria hyperparasitica]
MLEAKLDQSASTKNNTSDVVTDTDKAIEEMIKAALAETYPEYIFFGEETSKKDQFLTDDPTFICDPIDGTLNFTHGFGNFAVSLGMTLFKRPVLGVVYNPTNGEMFYGIKGQGAFLDRRGTIFPLPIRAPVDVGDLNTCIMAIEWGNDRAGDRWELRSRVHKQLLTKNAAGVMIQSIRSMGSAALDFCYVAAGQLDAFWEPGCYPWDVCAGWAILEEAGGRVFSVNPGEEAHLESRLYFAIRPGKKESQEAFARKVWGVMGNGRFVYPNTPSVVRKEESDDDVGLEMARRVKHATLTLLPKHDAAVCQEAATLYIVG